MASQSQPTIGYKAASVFGKALTKASQVANQYLPKTYDKPVVSNLGKTLTSQANNVLDNIQPKAYADGGVTQSKPLFTQEQLAANQAQHPVGAQNYLPSSSGQSLGGGGGNGGGGGDNGGGGNDYQAQLRAAYDQSRQALEGLLPTYDADFNNYKTSVEGAINDARGTLDTQKADVTKRYGDSLKNLLNTSKDLRQRTQSTFSGLGSLDSSAYGDELIKQQQADQEGVSNIDLSQNKDITELDSTFNTYERDQKTKLNSYQTDIDRAKQGVRQAMANGDIEQAQTLANYAQQVQANIDNLKLSLLSAQASGTDVLGNLRKINGVDFNNAFGQALGNRYNSATSRLVIPSAGAQGQGYIASSKNQDEQRRLLGLA